MSRVELQATLALLALAWNEPRQQMNIKSWAEVARVANFREIRNVLETMQWIAEIEHAPGSRIVDVNMRNPDTGEFIEDEIERRRDRIMEKAIAARHVEAIDAQTLRKYSSEVLKKWLKSCLSVCYENGQSELVIVCPECRNKTPSLAVNVYKGDYGVFYCHECGYGRGKYTLHLLAELGHEQAAALRNLEEINDQEA
jgi:hypothetical protein